MRTRIGYLIAAVVVVAAAVVVTLNVRSLRSAGPATGPGVAAPDKLPDIGKVNVQGLQLRDFDKAGKLRWRIVSSGKLDFDRTRMVARGHNIKWELQRGAGATLTLTAAEFVADYHVRRLSFSQGVAAMSSDAALSFESGSAVYDLTTERLQAVGPVRAHLRDYDGQAGGLTATRLGSQVLLDSGVELSYKDTRIHAAKAVVNTATRRAVASGGVQATRGAYRARASRADVDAVAQTVRLTGAIVLTRGDLVAHAAAASFSKQAAQATATGGVTLRGNGFTATGPRLVVDGDKKTATLSGGVHVTTTFRR